MKRALAAMLALSSPLLAAADDAILKTAHGYVRAGAMPVDLDRAIHRRRSVCADRFAMVVLAC